MNSLLSAPGFPPPHLFGNTRLSPTRSSSSPIRHLEREQLLKSSAAVPLPSGMMSGNRRKRKVDEEDLDHYGERHGPRDSPSSGDGDDRMSTSPSNSPAMASRPLQRPTSNRIKRIKPNITGRPLSIPRLLETLDAQALRSILNTLCERHPQLGSDVAASAGSPSVQAALDVLAKYEAALRGSFPFGGSPSSDYAYNRVRQPLTELLDSLSDFTPHFLPPNEIQAATSLSFLDGATDIIHRLPNWHNSANNHHKHLAYEEMAKAWALVIKEAAKKGAGIQLQYGGWDQKLAKHNEQSGGRMLVAMQELSSSLGWMGSGESAAAAAAGVGAGGDTSSIRQQLLSGTYGSNLPVRVGPW